ncbi:MAG: hypothetical protein ACHQCI_07470 [Solirubrobacterales bacterium]
MSGTPPLGGLVAGPAGADHPGMDDQAQKPNARSSRTTRAIAMAVVMALVGLSGVGSSD